MSKTEHRLNYAFQYKAEASSSSEKICDYQQRSVVQIEKYQILTERTSNERHELQKQIKFHQVIFIHMITSVVTIISGASYSDSKKL